MLGELDAARDAAQAAGAALRLRAWLASSAIDLTDQRHQLMEIFDRRLRGAISLARQFRQMLSSPLPTADIADLIAFNLLDDVALKQSLLAETDVKRRVGRVIAALEAIELVKPPISAPVGTENPNLN